MDEQNLSLSFGNPLEKSVAGIIGEYAELNLDALVENDLFKDIPIASTAIAVCCIKKSIHEKHHIVKQISFPNKTNNELANEEKRQNYREKFTSNFHKLRDSCADIILRLVELGFMAEDKSITATELRKALKGDTRSASQMSSDSKKKKI